jgi:hypothetical protein
MAITGLNASAIFSGDADVRNAAIPDDKRRQGAAMIRIYEQVADANVWRRRSHARRVRKVPGLATFP